MRVKRGPFESVQVVTVNNQIVVQGGRVVFGRERGSLPWGQAFGGVPLQRPRRNGQVMGIDNLFAFEVQGRHRSGSGTGQAEDGASATCCRAT